MTSPKNQALPQLVKSKMSKANQTVHTPGLTVGGGGGGRGWPSLMARIALMKSS